MSLHKRFPTLFSTIALTLILVLPPAVYAAIDTQNGAPGVAGSSGTAGNPGTDGDPGTEMMAFSGARASDSASTIPCRMSTAAEWRPIPGTSTSFADPMICSFNVGDLLREC